MSLTLAVLLLVGCAREPAVEQNARDLILVSVDALRADAVFGNGELRARTPHIDRLVEGGTYFEQAIVPMPRTTPTLGSLLTGLWPHRHGSREVGDAVTMGTTLAEVLRERGYATIAVSANASAGPRQGLDRGFDRFVGGEDLKELYSGRLYRDRTDVPPSGIGWAEAATTEVLRIVAEVPDEQPLFVWVFYFDPHFFYRPPSPWQDGIEAGACWQLYDDLSAGRLRCGEVMADRGGVARAALPGCRELYRAEVAYTDDQIGRLVEGIRADRGLDRALRVFTADHGENLGDAGMYYEHGESLHDAALRVPLAFMGPGVAEGRVDRGSTSLVDVMPTVLALLGVPHEEQPAMDGIDLSSRVRNSGAPVGADDHRAVFAESASALCIDTSAALVTGRIGGRHCINGPRYTLCRDAARDPDGYQLYDHVDDPRLDHDLAAKLPADAELLLAAWRNWPPESARQRAARTPGFKLVQTPRLEGGFATVLYDLEEDPAERFDVATQHPRLARDLYGQLEAWAEAIAVQPRRQRDQELIDVLRTLGYVD